MPRDAAGGMNLVAHERQSVIADSEAAWAYHQSPTLHDGGAIAHPGIAPAMNSFTLEAVEPAFRRYVVPTVAFATHGASHKSRHRQ
jgi:hypothetical protein